MFELARKRLKIAYVQSGNPSFHRLAAHFCKFRTKNAAKPTVLRHHFIKLSAQTHTFRPKVNFLSNLPEDNGENRAMGKCRKAMEKHLAMAIAVRQYLRAFESYNRKKTSLKILDVFFTYYHYGILIGRHWPQTGDREPTGRGALSAANTLKYNVFTMSAP